MRGSPCAGLGHAGSGPAPYLQEKERGRATNRCDGVHVAAAPAPAGTVSGAADPDRSGQRRGLDCAAAGVVLKAMDRPPFVLQAAATVPFLLLPGRWAWGDGP
jgi:hypothetical protein